MRIIRQLMQVTVLCSLALAACGAPSDSTPSGATDLRMIPERSASPCGGQVKRVGATLFVLPSGHDDTANLQCAFDAAVQQGPGAAVQLMAGDYYIAQVNVYGFEGRFSGAGMAATMIHNVPWPIPVTPIDYFTAFPAADWQWSGLLFFVGGDFTVSDLAVKISGFPITTGTTFSFWTLEPFTELQFGITALGEGTRAAISRVAIDSDLVPARSDQDPGASLYGTNLINAVMLAGLLNYEPISGSLRVQDSRIDNAATAVGLMSVYDSTAFIAHNELGGVFDAIDVFTGGGGMDLTFIGNEISAPFGIEFADWVDPQQPPIHNSHLQVLNNRLAGGAGIDLGATAYGSTWTFGANVKCLIAGNNVDEVTGAGIYLGPGTRGCVVAGTPADRVVDDGTDNMVVPPGHSHSRYRF